MQVDLTFQLALQGTFRSLAAWLPLPQNAPYQQRLALEHDGNAVEQTIHHDPVHGAPLLFVRWPALQSDPALTVSVRMETHALRCDLGAARADATFPEAVRPYLAASAHLPVTGDIRAHADRITHGKRQPADKLHALYDWVLDHAQRRFDVAWCGLGDVPAMLAAGEFCGKCADINSLLVALCRAAGLPARTLPGIRVAPSRLAAGLGASGEITQALHTRAEVYLGGVGWVPADPADALKLRDEGVPEAAWREGSTFLLGAAEANWVGYNHARDFVPVPPPQAGELNFFTVPHLEAEGVPLRIGLGSPEYRIFSRPTGSETGPDDAST